MVQISRENKKEICNKLLGKRASEFVEIKEKIDPNKLIYSFKTEGKLFKNLRDGDVEPKEVVRNK